MKNSLFIFLAVLFFSNSAFLQQSRLKNSFEYKKVNSKLDQKEEIVKNIISDGDDKKIEFIQPFKNQEFDNEDIKIILKYDKAKIKIQTISYSIDTGCTWKTLDTNHSILNDSMKIKLTCPDINSDLCKIKIIYIDDKSILGSVESEKFIINSTKGDNFAIISAIKSISGTKPSYEFIDINLFTTITSYFSVFMSADVAINTVQDTNSKTYKLSEAGLFLNFGQILCKGNLYNQQNRRFVFGPLIKIFNTVPYYGIYLGNAELNGKLMSSYISICWMRRCIAVNNDNLSIDDPLEFHDNIYFEFALHSQSVGFLKFLRIKGGFLVPIGGWQPEGPKVRDIVSRIVIEVPIGGLFRF
jgi:hypothetical protein